MKDLFFVFDVESIGLHGQGFAVGWVVVDIEGQELDRGYLSFSRDNAFGTLVNRKWVEENVIPHLPDPVHTYPQNMRSAFWDKWLEWKAKGATLWADCAWPVEARFLADCVDDNTENREWEGPYPLHEISTILFVAGIDPTGKFPRLENEEPAHHPTCDARQSARILIEALSKLEQ